MSNKTTTIKKINPFTAAEWCGTEKRADYIFKEQKGCAASGGPSADLVPRVLFYTGRREPRCDFFETFAFHRHQPRSNLWAPASTEHSKIRFYLLPPCLVDFLNTTAEDLQTRLLTKTHDWSWLYMNGCKMVSFYYHVRPDSFSFFLSYFNLVIPVRFR